MKKILFLCLMVAVGARCRAQSVIYANDNSVGLGQGAETATWVFTNSSLFGEYVSVEDAEGNPMADINTTSANDAFLTAYAGQTAMGYAYLAPGQSLVFAYNGTGYQVPQSNSFAVLDETEGGSGPGIIPVNVVGFDGNGNPTLLDGVTDISGTGTTYSTSGTDGAGDDVYSGFSPGPGQSGIPLSPGGGGASSAILGSADSMLVDGVSVAVAVATAIAAISGALLVWRQVVRKFGRAG